MAHDTNRLLADAIRANDEPAIIEYHRRLIGHEWCTKPLTCPTVEAIRYMHQLDTDA